MKEAGNNPAVKSTLEDVLTYIREEGGRKQSNRTPLAKQRGVERLIIFGGDKGKFLEWSRKVMQFVDEPGLRAILKRIATDPVIRKKEVDSLTRDALAEDGRLKMDMDDASDELYGLLVAITTDIPYSLVDGSQGDGWEAWRILHEEYHVITLDSKRKILSRVIQPKQVNKYSEILKAQAEWEGFKANYEEMAKPIEEELLITGYLGMLANKVQDAVHALEGEINNLRKLKEYVRKQVHAHSEDNTKDLLSTETEPVTEKQNEETEEEAMSLQKGGYKGGGNKGGGKGGKCWHCDKPGHQKRDCPDLDKIMEQYRQSGGKAGGAPWQSKGGWKGQHGGGGWQGKGNNGYFHRPAWNNKGGGKGYEGGGKGYEHYGGWHGGRGGSWYDGGGKGGYRGKGGRPALGVEAFGAFLDNGPSQQDYDDYDYNIFSVLEEPEGAEEEEEEQQAAGNMCDCVASFPVLQKDGAGGETRKMPRMQRRATQKERKRAKVTPREDLTDEEDLDAILDEELHRQWREAQSEPTTCPSLRAVEAPRAAPPEEPVPRAAPLEEPALRAAPLEEPAPRAAPLEEPAPRAAPLEEPAPGAAPLEEPRTTTTDATASRKARGRGSSCTDEDDEEFMQKINTMLDEMETQYESGSEGQTESAFSLEDEETEGGSCGVYSHEEYDDYARVEAVVDSGSADFVSSREMTPNVTVRRSAGSQRGQHFISASGKRMANEGEQHLQIMTEEGTAAQIPWQITGV